MFKNTGSECFRSKRACYRLSQISDDDLRNKTEQFRRRLKDGESLDELTCEAFAVVLEAA
jgi:preprotein translocase subunit SecA